MILKYQIQQLTVQRNGPKRWTVIFETLSRSEAYKALDAYRHAIAVNGHEYGAPVHLVHISRVVNAGPS